MTLSRTKITLLIFLLLVIGTTIAAPSGGRSLAQRLIEAPPLSFATAPYPTIGPIAPVGLAILESPPRKFVLADDELNIPEHIVYEDVIALNDVYSLFGQGQDTRALIVSRQLLDGVTHPTSGFGGSDGSPEYYALLFVLWNSHVLVGIDSTSELIADRLALDGPAPFDPFRRTLITMAEIPGFLLAATALGFTVEGGWEEVRVEAPASTGAPPYEMVDQWVSKLLGAT